MTLKQFLKPDWRKIVIFILIALFCVLPYLFIRIGPPLDPIIIFFMNLTKVLGWPWFLVALLSKSLPEPSYLIRLGIFITSTLILLFFWYFLSCLIIWIYDNNRFMEMNKMKKSIKKNFKVIIILIFVITILVSFYINFFLVEYNGIILKVPKECENYYTCPIVKDIIFCKPIAYVYNTTYKYIPGLTFLSEIRGFDNSYCIIYNKIINTKNRNELIGKDEICKIPSANLTEEIIAFKIPYEYCRGTLTEWKENLWPGA